jgi:hypothetical protein
MKHTPIAIITAELAQLNFHDNVERTNALRLELLSAGYSIIGVKLNGLTGFIVETNSPNKLKKLAQKYEQSSIYFSDNERNSFRISSLAKGKKFPLGKLTKSDTMLLARQLRLSFYENGKEHNFVTES